MKKFFVFLCCLFFIQISSGAKAESGLIIYNDNYYTNLGVGYLPSNCYTTTVIRRKWGNLRYEPYSQIYCSGVYNYAPPPMPTILHGHRNPPPIHHVQRNHHKPHGHGNPPPPRRHR